MLTPSGRSLLFQISSRVIIALYILGSSSSSFPWREGRADRFCQPGARKSTNCRTIGPVREGRLVDLGVLLEA